MAVDLEFKRGDFGTAAEIVATVTWTEAGRTLAGVTGVTGVFKAAGAAPIEIAGTVKDAAANKLSVILSEANWTSLSGKTFEFELVLAYGTASRVTVPSGKPTKIKFREDLDAAT